MKTIHSQERSFLEKLPVYDDEIKAEMEGILRRHLYRDHFAVASKTGVPSVRSTEDIPALVDKKLLVPVKSTEAGLFYFYNVRDDNRYLTPAASGALERISRRFNERLKEKGLGTVKLALSSALRPAEYQKNLRSSNENAVMISTHSYGASFDIFHDEYYVVLPEAPAGSRAGNSLMARIRRQYGFLLGEALRRQFRAVLFHTLVELQDSGEIYVTAEKNQRCYHVTALR